MRVERKKSRKIIFGKKLGNGASPTPSLPFAVFTESNWTVREGGGGGEEGLPLL